MAQENADSIVICKNAAFGYEGHSVIRDISFEVRRGDYLYITGENGSGKSTLLKGILRLANPISGRISFSPEIQNGGAGYLAQQEAAKKDFPASAGEIVLSGFAGKMGLRPFYLRREKEAALENMRRLEVSDLKERCFRELSGGQQRRVLIARALCAAGAFGVSGSLLVLDEPAAGLDPSASAVLYELLDGINKNGMTIISVTHDIQAAERFASRIMQIKDGLCFLRENK
ncbi:MAG: ATP-binding cassette domain-containing protein [Spirochaetaceae bacterium]|jgi:zinc transport system ATP-binding protein|nr:ATP-binding cassette domain-containing protein [Spirochaetaceae bacterium]GMO26207.1 MAG: metal ABC transporter ATP-binding protein [Termitinemataceae bacterium]